MAIASRRVLEYPFHSRLSRLACLALGVALLWFGSGQLTITGLLLMFSGLVIAVSAVQPPQPWAQLADRSWQPSNLAPQRQSYRATSPASYPTAQLPSSPAT